MAQRQGVLLLARRLQQTVWRGVLKAQIDATNARAAEPKISSAGLHSLQLKTLLRDLDAFPITCSSSTSGSVKSFSSYGAAIGRSAPSPTVAGAAKSADFSLRCEARHLLKRSCQNRELILFSQPKTKLADDSIRFQANSLLGGSCHEPGFITSLGSKARMAEKSIKMSSTGLLALGFRAAGRGGFCSQARASVSASVAEKLTRRSQQAGRDKSQSMLMYLVAMVVAVVGVTYASVPLYRRFCQATGYGGTVQRRQTVEEKIASHETDATVSRELVVHFNADVADSMPWKFTPCQSQVKVKVGQSTLAFYTAENTSSEDITGVSTYNVAPMQAGAYFIKIQCFCFEEQRLRAGEKIDMPVLFYLDPEFAADPKMDNINSLILSYTFFKVEDEEEEE